MSHRPTRLVVALLAASAVLGLGFPAPSALAAPPDPAATGLDWIEGELAADGGKLQTSFDAGPPDGVQAFDDWGLTIDAVLALAAGGRGSGAAATTADGLVEDNVAAYVTSGAFGPDDRYAGALAKTLLMALVQGEDPTDFGGFDLVDELLDRMQATGSDAGRFSDLTGFGDFSNGFGQALALLALARTGDVPQPAVDFLLDQQCPGGGFRGDYTTSGGCTADSAATVDATGFALQALTAVTPTCATRQAVTDAVTSLLAGQNGSGAFGGETGSNTNSTGLAAVALRSLGKTGAAADAAGFVAGLQLATGDDAGAVALNPDGLASAGDGVQVLERDGFRRATTQGVLAFGLPSYAEIGTTPVDPTDFTPCPVAPPVAVDAAGTLSATTVVAGGALTVSGTGFEPGEPVTATLRSTPVDLGTLTADDEGGVELTFTVPADLEPGGHEVELLGQRSGRGVILPFEVLAPPADPDTLPATGRTTGPAAGAGIGLVGVGAALVGLARRRQSAGG